MSYKIDWRTKIKSFWPFIIISIMSFYFFKKLYPMPLLGDQLTYGTILDHLHHPEWFTKDPLYGIQNIYLPLNLGVLSFDLLSKFLPSIEIGINYGLGIIMFFYLLSSYIVFYKISKFTHISLALSLLSALPIWIPGSTLWGIGLSNTFLSRTIFLPLIPLFFYYFLKMIDNLTKKKIIYFYSLLGLSAYIHQISSLYLFLTFWTTLLIIRYKHIKLHFLGIICWLLPLTPFLIYHFHYHPTNLTSIPASVLQKWIEIRYSWAFNPAMGQEIFNFLVKNPLLISTLCIVPLLFNKNRYINYLKIIIITLIVITFGFYWIQYFVLNTFQIPFKFIELGRGIRFLPFIAFLLLACCWEDVKQYFSSKYLSTAISLYFLIFAIFMFTNKYNLLSKNYSLFYGYTCKDPIFEKIKELPPNILIATNGINNLRYCSKHPVYVIFKDGAVAFYNGQEQFSKWIKRFILNQTFFTKKDLKFLKIMQKQGITHIVTKHPFSSLGDSLKMISCSEHYCLYKVEIKK